MRVTGWRVDSAIAPATSAVLTKKYSGATTAAVRTSAATSGAPVVPIVRASGRPATVTVNVSDAMLNSTRCSGLCRFARRVHWAQALTVAIQTACAGPSANSAQKFTTCESDRLDWLRPSGNGIFAADVAMASASNIANNTA